MPRARRPRPPDLDRVAQVFARDVPAPGRSGTGGLLVDDLRRVDDPVVGGWVPGRPGGVVGGESRHGLTAPESAPEEVHGEVHEPPREAATRTARRSGTESAPEVAVRRARRPGLVTVPDAVRRARTGVSSTAVVAVLALTIAVGCLFAVRVLWAERPGDRTALTTSETRTAPGGGRSGTPHQVVTSAPGPAASSGPPPAGASPSGPSTTPAAKEVVVHVAGQVARPGIVRLRPGARVADAIEAAGGARRSADLGSLNLARVLHDGEQVFVPQPGQAPPVVSGGGDGDAGGGGGSGTGGSGRGAGGVSGAEPVDLNRADLAALDSLPGVGPVLAQRILDWRAEHGRFTSVDELAEVSGIGPKVLETLRSKVTV